MIQQLHDIGVLITISTNASLLDKHKESLMLVDHLQLSVDGWDKESYEYLQPPNKFEKTRKSIHDFFMYAVNQNEKPFISFNLLLTKQTDLEQFRITWGHYADDITLNHLMGTTYYNGNRFITEQSKQLKDYFYPFTIDYTHGCEYPFDVLTVAFDGKIALCCQDYNAELPLGHISEGIQNVFKRISFVRKAFLRGTPLLCQGCSRFYKVKP